MTRPANVHIPTLEASLVSINSRREAARTAAQAAIAPAEAEGRQTLTTSEQATFDQHYSQVRLLDDEAAQVRTNLDNARSAERRQALVNGSVDATTRANGGRSVAESAALITREARTYNRGDYRTSFVRDMWDVAVGNANAGEARERLTRNVREVEVETRALTTGTGAGGEFAPPLWLVEAAVTLARAARPTADAVTRAPLPAGIASVNVPKVATGTAVGQQATQNGAVQNTDATTTSVTAAITTLAGLQSLSQQLIDQSGVAIDDLLLQDLLADLAVKVNLLVLNNNATNAKGLLQQAGTLPVAYTSAAPNAKLLLAAIANAASQVQSARFLPPTHVIMHPRRWLALLGASDSSNRPLADVMTLGGSAAMNSVVRATDNAAAGVVGNIAGLDVIADPSIPTNLGAGSNQDQVIVTRAADQVLWESVPKAEAFRETKADTLTVLLRVFEYAAFTAARYPASTAVVSGTGLVAPAFDGT